MVEACTCQGQLVAAHLTMNFDLSVRTLGANSKPLTIAKCLMAFPNDMISGNSSSDLLDSKDHAEHEHQEGHHQQPLPHEQ